LRPEFESGRKVLTTRPSRSRRSSSIGGSRSLVHAPNKPHSRGSHQIRHDPAVAHTELICLLAFQRGDEPQRPARLLAFAASISCSTSVSVRYSRERSSALGLRRGGATVPLTEAGTTTRRLLRAMESSTVPTMIFLGTVSQAANFNGAMDTPRRPEPSALHAGPTSFRRLASSGNR
jgi:hypothetical protein